MYNCYKTFTQINFPTGGLAVLGTVMENMETWVLDSLSLFSDSLTSLICPPTSPHPAHTPHPPPTHCTDKLYIRDPLCFSLLSFNIHFLLPRWDKKSGKKRSVCERTETAGTDSKYEFLGSIFCCDMLCSLCGLMEARAPVGRQQHTAFQVGAPLPYTSCCHGDKSFSAGRVNICRSEWDTSQNKISRQQRIDTPAIVKQSQKVQVMSSPDMRRLQRHQTWMHWMFTVEINNSSLGYESADK